jgi:hypothetical protein
VYDHTGTCVWSYRHVCMIIPTRVYDYTGTCVWSYQHVCMIIPARVYDYTGTCVWSYRHVCMIIPTRVCDHTGNNCSQRNCKKGFGETFGTITGKYSIDSLQKTAILRTSHITRKVLQSDTWSLSGGGHRWFKRGNVKVKFALEQATKAQRGSRVRYLLFL